MNNLNFVQIYKENRAICKAASTLWVPFVKETNEHDGIVQTEEQILEGLKKRIAIQGMRADMHFEVAFYNNTAIGIAMFAVDLGTVYGLLEKGYGTVMGFYICPEYRRRGLGKAFWSHIEEVLKEDGASKFYICPDSVTGIPFWKSLKFEDSGLIDPDDNKPIYIKKDSDTVLEFIQMTQADTEAIADFFQLIPAYMKELDDNAGRVYKPEWALKWAKSMIKIQGDPDRHLELCYADKNLVGFLYGKKDHAGHNGYIRPGWGYIMEFYVLPKYRRSGIGKMMWARLERLFKSDEITQVYLTSDSVTGEPFWKAMGFINSGMISSENNLAIYEKNI